MGNAAIEVQCTLYTDEERSISLQGIANSGFEIKAVNEEASTSANLLQDNTGTPPVGVSVFELLASTLTVPGIYHLEANIAGLSITNRVFRVVDSFSLVSSSITKASSGATLV